MKLLYFLFLITIQSVFTMKQKYNLFEELLKNFLIKNPKYTCFKNDIKEEFIGSNYFENQEFFSQDSNNLLGSSEFCFKLSLKKDLVKKFFS